MRHIFGSQGANCNNYPKVCVWDALTDILKKYKENMSKNVITNKVLRNSFRAKIAHILRLYLPVNLKWGIYLLAKCQIAKTTSYTMYEMVVQIYWRMGWRPSASKIKWHLPCSRFDPHKPNIMLKRGQSAPWFGNHHVCMPSNRKIVSFYMLYTFPVTFIYYPPRYTKDGLAAFGCKNQMTFTSFNIWPPQTKYNTQKGEIVICPMIWQSPCMHARQP